MNHYKVIATLTWKLDSSKNHSECIEMAKRQLEKIIETNPSGDGFENFTVQVDLAKMKPRNKLIHIKEFSLNEVFDYVTFHDYRRSYYVDGQEYIVKMNSDRYQVFKNSNICAACGIEGKKFILDINPGDKSPHFNLYAEENGRLVLMTKDHIVAKSCGGSNTLDNYTTMCATCNNLKSHYNLTNNQVAELRKLYDNKEMLPKKELRELINRRRREMSNCPQEFYYDR